MSCLIKKFLCTTAVTAILNLSFQPAYAGKNNPPPSSEKMDKEDNSPKSMRRSSQPINKKKNDQEADDKLFEFLQSAFEEIEKDINRQKNKTIIIGATGAGKSTLFNYMQHDLQYMYKQADVVYQRRDGQPLASAIKEGPLSETKFPMRGDRYDDCPGFEDTTYAEQAIINAYSINRLLEKTSSAKVLLVANYSELKKAERGGPFVKRIARLGRMFSNDIDKFIESLAFVVTDIAAYRPGESEPIPKEENINLVKKILKGYIKAMSGISRNIVAEDEIKNTIKILHALKDKSKKNVEVFCTPKHTRNLQDLQKIERESIESMLKERTAIQKVDPILVIDPAGKVLLERFFSRSLIECQKIIDETFKNVDESIKGYIESSKSSVKTLRDSFAGIGKQIRIDSLSPEKFTETLEIFHSKTSEIFRQDNNFHKHLERFKFMKKLTIGLDNQDPANVRIAEQIIESINKISEKFSLISECRLETADKRLKLSGGIVGTSDLPENISHFSEIDVFSLHSLVLDKDVKASGANITFFSPNWVKKSEVKIDLSGKDGEKVIKKPASGDGLRGKPGSPGGNFFGNFKNIFGERSLTIISKGGKGSNGTKGAQGEKGEDGYTLEAPESLDNFSDILEKYIFNTKKISTSKGAVRGKKGGQGFSGGAKGLGGNKGTIELDLPVLKEMIITIAEDGNDGKAGKAGKGGSGGLYPDIPETFEEHNETAFGRVKNVGLRRVAQIGTGLLSIGVIPIVTGFSAWLHSYTNKNNCNIELYENSKRRAPSGEVGEVSQDSEPALTRDPIKVEQKKLEYKEFCERSVNHSQ